MIATRRRGATLVEVASATVITSLLLIPSLTMLNDSRRLSQRHETREQLVFEAQRLIDTSKADLADETVFLKYHSQSRGVVDQGALTGVPIQNGSYRVTTLPDPNYRVKAAEVLTIRVDVWQDTNRNRAVDADEPSAVLLTKLSRPRKPSKP